MDELIEQIEIAKENSLYMLCLYSVLTLPDMAGAINSSNGKATGAKYKEWFEKYVSPNILNITGSECYEFRCKVLHQGQSQPNQASYYDKIGFLEPGPNKKFSVQIGSINSPGKPSLKVIDLKVLVDAMLKGWSEWKKEKEGTEPFEKNYSECIKRYPNGYGSVSGFPFIC